MNEAKVKGFMLITGASSGIGLSLACEAARQGYRLIVHGRDKERTELALQKVKECSSSSLAKQHKALVLDLSRADAVDTLIEQLGSDISELTHLINNAGFGDYDLFIEADNYKLNNMLRVNVEVLLDLTHKVLKIWEKTNIKRYILNVASVASFQPGPYMATYYATKSFVLSWSEALYQELKSRGILVATLCPGPTRTRFDKIAGRGAEALFNRFSTQSADFVATYTLRKLQNNKRLIIPGILNKILIQLPRFLPRIVVLKFVARLQKIRK